MILDYPHKDWAKYGAKELWTICYNLGVPQFISQSFDLFLEDEPYSTSYHGNTKKHITMHLHTSDKKKLKKKLNNKSANIKSFIYLFS